MNDSEIKKNQVHDLSDASSALSAEILAVSKGVEKLPSVGVGQYGEKSQVVHQRSGILRKKQPQYKCE